MKKLQNFLKSYPKSRILDIGTGTGTFIKTIISLDDNYLEIIGIDVLENAISASTKNFEGNKRIHFEKMDALHLTFEEHSFDIVCLSNSLHHLEDIGKTIKEMERMLKPNGALLFNEMISNGLSNAQISHKFLHHFAAEIDRENGLIHYDTFDGSKILSLLKKHSTLSVQENWVMLYERQEHNSKEEIDFLFQTMDRLIEKVKSEKKVKYFTRKAEDIKKYISKYGFDSATQKLFVLK
ncbi:MAG: methyltransferase domain-containing protein [Firmicutes bacterium]|nr:methyltransferase domain-containing protein [Bacillota bacterium]